VVQRLEDLPRDLVPPVLVATELARPIAQAGKVGLPRKLEQDAARGAQVFRILAEESLEPFVPRQEPLEHFL
jgi:hypothetical protein